MRKSKLKHTEERLSVALWLGSGPLFVSARTMRLEYESETQRFTRDASSRAVIRSRRHEEICNGRMSLTIEEDTLRWLT